MKHGISVLMRRRPAVCRFLCITVLVLIAACGKDEIKQVSTDSILSQEAISVAEAVRSAYARKDFSAIREVSTPAGYTDIMDSVKYFDSVELSFAPKWVELARDKVYLNVAWKGVWTISGEAVAERGMAVFLFEGKPLKLSRIMRGNPFGHPER